MLLVWPPMERAYWMSFRPIGQVSELVIRVYTSNGPIGIGEVHSKGGGQSKLQYPSGARNNAAAMTVVDEILAPMLIGEDPLDTERLWAKMFARTYSKPGIDGMDIAAFLAGMAGIDQALWDIRGKVANLPIYRLLGGTKNKIPCLVTGGYYQDGKGIPELVAECEGYVKMGYKAMKLKAGMLSVEEDIARLKAVRDAIGPDIDIVVDVNAAYDIPTAIRAGLEMEEHVGLRWYEEPIYWFNRTEGHRRVAAALSTPVSAGSQDKTRWEAMQMALHGGVSLMQFDCTQQGGPTEWLKIANFCDPLGITMAPHHDPQIHGHLMASIPNAEILETFPNADRDPVWAELFAQRPEIRNGELELLDEPGWGIILDEDVVKKRRVNL